MPQYSGPERILNDGPTYRAVESITGATDTWTTDDSGTLFLLNKADGIDITLPSLTADDVGTWYEVFVQTALTSDTITITAQSGDLLAGKVLNYDTDTSNATAWYAPDGSDDLIITLNQTTTGGGVGGDHLRLVATSATQWLVTGVVYATGVVATPFS